MQTYRTNFEKEAAKKIKDTLETIMGKDNVSVQVTTTMDFNQTRATIESYTPNRETDAGVVVATQGEKEIYSNPKDLPSNQTTASGESIKPTDAQVNAQNEMTDLNNQQNNNPQVTANNELGLPLNQTPAKTVNYEGEKDKTKNSDELRKLSYEKEKSATQYAVTKEVRQVVYAPGSVTRMTVAVAVNKILTEAEKDEIKALVSAAAGMDASRGDVVSVSSLKFTGIDKTEELKLDKEAQRRFILDVLTFIFKNVAPIVIILVLGAIALNNLGSIFAVMKPKDENLSEKEENSAPAFDPYLMLQQNQTTPDDFYQQDIQFTSAVDAKKNEIINTVMGNPEEAARIITSYIKE